jgi:hypothetical protein
MATQLSNFGLVFEQVSGSAPGHSAGEVQLYASSSTNEAGTTQLFMKDSAGEEYVVGGAFKVEDGDGTELAISGGAQLKFVDGGGTNGLDINWSDVSHGIDGDEYDLTFKVDIVNLAASTGVDDADLVMIDDGAGGTLRKMTRAHFIESAALDNINIDGGAIDGTPIGANSAAAGTFAAIVGTSAVVNGNAAVSGTLHVTGNSQLQGTLEAKGAASFEAAITAQDALSVAGKLSGSNGIYISGDSSLENVLVRGDLDVQGAINTITNHETELHIADKVILIASGTSKNDGAAALGALDGGGVYLGSTGSLAVASIRWDAGNDRWHTDESLHVSGAMNVGDSAVFSNDVAITGTLSAQGVVSFNGDVNLGDASSDTVTVTGQFDSDLVPSTDGARDLGSSAKEWKDLYIDGVAYVDDLRADALGAAMNCASQAMTNINVDSGAIDGTVIGANSAAAGTFAAMVATSAVVNGNSALSGTLHVTGNSQLQGTLEAKGAASFEAAITAQDALSVAGKLSGSNGLRIQGDAQFDDVLIGDDKKLAFGAGSDASFEYDEDGNDVLLYSGASMRFSDDVKLEFGAAGDASIEYDEDGTDQLRIAAPAAGVVIAGTTPTLVIGDAGAEDTKLVFDGNAQDFYMGLDDSADKLLLGLGSTVGTTPNMSLYSADRSVQFHGHIIAGANSIVDGGLNSAITFDGSGGTAVVNGLVVAGGYGSTGVSISPAGAIQANGSLTVDTSATFGGGYGSTGATISAAGALQLNSGLTVDDAATFGGGYGSTGVTISNAGAIQANGALQLDGTLTQGADGAGVDAKFFGGDANEYMLYDASANHLQFQNASAALVLEIGASSNGYALEVAQLAGDAGKIKATAFVTYSDETLKEEVTAMDNALDAVMSLNGVEFTWKNSGERDFGFLAQEVKSVIPQAVSVGSDGIHGVDYSRLTSVLVEAVKAQQVQIEDLKKVITNIKK